MDVRFYDFGAIPDSLIKYVVILVRYQNKWVLSKHKDRTTWEFAGGHREKGESLDESASRELFEETGAIDFSIIPVSIYSVSHVDDKTESFGQLYISMVNKFDQLPDFEMSEIRAFEHIPENLTYPGIYPALIELVTQHITVEQRPMKYDFNRVWLAKKFEEIQRRTLKAIEQLDEDQLNWKPNDHSHSIPDLIRHIEGNMHRRIRMGILNEVVTLDQVKERTEAFMTISEAKLIIQHTLQIIINVVEDISDETLDEFQTVRGKQRTNLDMLHQCAAHYSEHMGQIFYIAKQCLGENYQSTSV